MCEMAGAPGTSEEGWLVYRCSRCGGCYACEHVASADRKTWLCSDGVRRPVVFDQGVRISRAGMV